MAETEVTKWISPKAERMASQRAKDRANAVRWNLDVAVFLFGVLAIVFILGFEGVSIWIMAPVAIFGLAMVWLVGWRRARQVYGRFLDEELSKYAVDFEDYYKILRISPSAESEDIIEAYKRLIHIYDEALSDKKTAIPMFSLMKRKTSEAYQILSDPIAKTAYDRVFWAKLNPETVEIGQATTQEILGLTESITQYVLKGQRRIGWRIPKWVRVTRQAVIGVVIALLSTLLILSGGTALAFANPEHPIAAPFKGIAITATQASSGAISLIEYIRGVIATYERNIVSTALQSMRVTEGLGVVPAVTVSTNDMARFPSPDHCLFPDYLDKRFSQFKYTVDSSGIMSVDTSGATTDALLEKIKQLFDRLAERE